LVKAAFASGRLSPTFDAGQAVSCLLFFRTGLFARIALLFHAAESASQCSVSQET